MAINPEAWLYLKRTVRFGDTDAAGVMHFLQLLRWCHEAWEESLEKYGLTAIDIFPNFNIENTQSRLLVGLPIVHCEADFWYPLYTGDSLEIELTPEKLDRARFQIKYKFNRDNDYVAQGLIKHQAIDLHTRSSCNLPEGIEFWIEASTLRNNVTSCE